MAEDVGERRASFGEVLRRHRALAGISQEALAARSGLTREAISLLERGERLAPRTSTVVILADALRLRAQDREAFIASAHRPPRAASAEGPPPPVPRELPRPPADFTGRAGELDALRGLLAGEGGPGTIAAIDGMGGAGKSALALQAAHEAVEGGAFPDGQLYVNLHGAAVGHAPLEPLDGLGRMLRALGRGPDAIPAEVEEAAAGFRSLVAGRRLLVLLDDARDAEQVRPLLPGGTTCRVLVTSRQVLATLEGASAVHLDVLPPEQAVELLGRVAGPRRVAAEPEAAGDVVRRCGHLPLAVRIAGARLAARPAWPVRELARQLDDGARRLDELRAGELAVEASFDVSLDALRAGRDPADRAAAGVFGLLSLPDGTDVALETAARLIGEPEPAAQALLERLVDASLLESPRPGRYQFHDLARAHGRRVAARTIAEPERVAALVRAMAFSTATAWRTMDLLRPGSWRLRTADPRWTDGGVALADAQEALAWLEAERPNLLAGVAQSARLAADGGPGVLAELAVQLARALFGFFVVRGNWHDCARANEVAVAAARTTGDRAAEASARIDLGTAHMRLGRSDEAIANQRAGVAALRELGDRRGLAVGLDNLSISHRWLGQHAEAIACLRESLTIYEELDDRAGRASGLNNLGLLYQRLERYEEAIACQEESLGIVTELGDRRVQASCLNCLGVVFERLGRHEEAIGRLRESVAICRELGARMGEADSLNDLGVVSRGLGRHAEAMAYHDEALDIFRELGSRRSQALVLRDLGDTLRAAGRERDAVAAWREALAIFEEVAMPEADEVRVRLGLGRRS